MPAREWPRRRGLPRRGGSGYRASQTAGVGFGGEGVTSCLATWGVGGAPWPDGRSRFWCLMGVGLGGIRVSELGLLFGEIRLALVRVLGTCLLLL